MDQLLSLANWLLPIFYAALLIEYGASFFLRTRSHGRNYWLLAVAIFHAAFLVLLARHLNRALPINNYEVLSFLSLATLTVYIVVEYAGQDRRSGAFVLLAATIFQYTSSMFIFRVPAVVTPELSSVWARLHTVPAMVAYTAFTISGIYGILHLLAERDLRQHRFGLLFDRLPALDRLGTMCLHAMLLGFVFLTAAVVSGAIMHSRRGGEGVDLKILSKIVIGSVAWLLYAVALAGKAFGKWRVSRTAVFSVAGFILILALLTASIVLS
jgi:ABC-type uncharacterized transport system permease subunit